MPIGLVRVLEFCKGYGKGRELKRLGVELLNGSGYHSHIFAWGHNPKRKASAGSLDARIAGLGSREWLVASEY